MKIILLFVSICCLLSLTLCVDLQALSDVATEDYTKTLIQSEGYLVEEYVVNTTDGYVLKLLRMPGSKQSASAKNKTVVFLMHGLLCSSMDWLILGDKKALPYMLVDAGFDVFLGNARGNTHSRRHVHLSPTSRDFWKFSWHEIGTIDIPAMIDFALSLTQQRDLHYVGHSQGTTSFFVGASTQKELNEKVRTMHALAPVAFMGRLKSPLLRAMAPLVSEIQLILRMMGVFEFLPSHDLMVKGGMHVCQRESPLQELCANALFLLAGYDSSQLNRTVLAQLVRYTPAGSSVDQLVHYAQCINSGEFRMFDHGLVNNIVKYGKVHPPSYRLDRISTPVYLYYGDNDWLAAVRDVEQLARKLANLREIYRIPMERFNHLDFLYGNDADALVYERILEIIKEN